MQLSTIYSALPAIGESQIIEIEADIVNRGIPGFNIVGMGDKAIDESRERINAALKNCGLAQPKQKKTIVSLSPAHIRKKGTLFDVPIALAVLCADKENGYSLETDGALFIGELSLSGDIKPIRGALSVARAAEEYGYTSVYVPRDNAEEASLIEGVAVYGIKHIRELIDHLDELTKDVDEKNIQKVLVPVKHLLPEERVAEKLHSESLKDRKSSPLSLHIHDFAHIVKQDHAKRALEIAAAGGHNIALYGPPGTGKTMLAKALCTILPPLTRAQSIESTIIHSHAGVLRTPAITSPPFRAPHHTASYVSVIGGGAYPKPGEVTLAHNGVLFLDEFPEFESRVLESLREPLEEHVVRISRAQSSAVFPASVLLVAALNPPSAVYRSESLISASDERRFKKKLSGPIMDRIDMWVEVPHVDHSSLLSGSRAESSNDISLRVVAARHIQENRNEGLLNSRLSSTAIQETLGLRQDAADILNKAAHLYSFSPRVYHKVIKLGRTIADLDASYEISPEHILEALQYRPKEFI